MSDNDTKPTDTMVAIEEAEAELAPEIWVEASEPALESRAKLDDERFALLARLAALKVEFHDLAKNGCNAMVASPIHYAGWVQCCGTPVARHVTPVRMKLADGTTQSVNRLCAEHHAGAVAADPLPLKTKRERKESTKKAKKSWKESLKDVEVAQ